jgi:RNA polymerase sigma-70 factor (ECF subfamily)
MDEASFRRMYEDTARRVYAYVRRRSDEATAESVVSEVFLKAWKHGSALTGDPLPWLLVTARTTLYDHWRREGRRQRLTNEFTVLHREDVVTGIEDVAIDRADLRRILLTLAPDDREALLLVGWDGLSQADAALVAGCSLAAFKARVNRARARLARLLDPDGPALLRPASQEA